MNDPYTGTVRNLTVICDVTFEDGKPVKFEPVLKYEATTNTIGEPYVIGTERK